MKKTLFATAIGMACVMSFPAAQASCHWTGQRVGLMGSGAVIGTLVAGPVGTVLGAAVGDWLDGSSKACGNSDAKTAPSATFGQVPTAEPEHYKEIPPFGTKGEASVYFSTGSHTLSVNGKQVLSEAASALRQNPMFDLEVIGTADPRGKNGYDNMALSTRRATAVKKYLVNEENIGKSRIFAKGIGPVHASDVPYKQLREAKLKLLDKKASSM